MSQWVKKLKGGNGKKDEGVKWNPESVKKIVDRCYKAYLEDPKNKTYSQPYFHHAVCKTIEEINVEIGGSAQFLIPSHAKIIELYNKNRSSVGQISRDKFADILGELVTGAQIGGGGKFKDVVLYIFGFPITAVLVKQFIAPDAIPNDILIPAVTSLSVFALAKQNKI